MKNVFIIGSRGYNFNYGGWETFVTNLVNYSLDKDSTFYIPYLTHNKRDNYKVSKKDNLVNINIYTKKSGFTTMFYFTIKSIKYVLKYIKDNNLNNCVLVILGCKIGPLMPLWYKKFHKLNVKIVLNPDGLEWKRDKWSWWIKECFKLSERKSVKYSDHVVCDSKSIKRYIDDKYKIYNKSSFIAYGSSNTKGIKNNNVKKMFKNYGIHENDYYLIVGRFVPENNYETMIREFMNSKSKRDLVIITNLEHDKFYDELLEKTNFTSDSRIKFVGPFYDQEGLIYIRENAYGYIHGHSAGGTNPSLIEALSRTNLNILFDVSYNKEVGVNSCYYFTKEEGSLQRVIDKVDNLGIEELIKLGLKCKKRVKEDYTWELISTRYDVLFEDLLDE